MLETVAIVVLTTVANQLEAEELAEKVVRARFAACVQIVPAITSYYHWQGEVQKDQETLLLIKTVIDKFDAVADFIREHHSYEVPEIVALPAERIGASYLKWLRESVR